MKFVKPPKRIRKFPEKVIKYLWDDAFKFNPQDLFDTTRFDNLEDIIRHFVFHMAGVDLIFSSRLFEIHFFHRNVDDAG